MAYSKQDLVEKLNAEEVGGQFIAGPIGGRVFVGKINEEGVFFITPEGEEMLEAAGKEPVTEDKPKAAKAKKVETPTTE